MVEVEVKVEGIIKINRLTVYIWYAASDSVLEKFLKTAIFITYIKHYHFLEQARLWESGMLTRYRNALIFFISYSGLSVF